MQSIREYNKGKNYNDESLDYHETSDGNVYGTSTFLDDGAKNGYFTENTRSKKWTTWEEWTGSQTDDGIGPSWK
jgi:hypothetical protein